MSKRDLPALKTGAVVASPSLPSLETLNLNLRRKGRCGAVASHSLSQIQSSKFFEAWISLHPKP